LLALWLVLPVSVVLAGQAGTPVLRRAGRFGDLSYGLYIYAFPVQQTLIWQLKDQLSWGALLALTIATTTVLAFASWHLVEKRALRLKPGRSND
jgi:peptidoglycan/LPS O-acetylase OafA/YrhL